MRIRAFTAIVAALLVVSPALAGDRVHTMTGLAQKFNNPTAVTRNGAPAIQRNMPYGRTTVSLVGVSPAGIELLSGDFAETGGTFRLFPSIASLAQLASTFTEMNQSGTFVGGGGPATASVGGTVGFCNVVGVNPANPNCVTPGEGTGGRTGVVRILPVAGKSQFGGTLKFTQKRAGGLALQLLALLVDDLDPEDEHVQVERHGEEQHQRAADPPAGRDRQQSSIYQDPQK